MGVYDSNSGSQQAIMEGELQNPNELLEAYIYDELCSMTDEDKRAFVNSPEASAMVEAGLIQKKTLVRLTRSDDLSRRLTMACFQMAKENKDPLWDQLVKNRIKERNLIGQIKKKYASRATKTAKMGQKQYLKSKMPVQLMKPTRIA